MSTIFDDCDLDWSDGADYRDSSFTRCVITGPAILDLRNSSLVDSVLDYTPRHRRPGSLACVTYSDERPPAEFPHVRLRSCAFSDCVFTDVWVWAGTALFPKTRLGQWWFMRRHFTFENVTRKIYRGDS